MSEFTGANGMRRSRDATPLPAIIRHEIQRDGPMTFARFMERALYHPEYGYYAGGGLDREPLGWAGDYVTSGDVHPLWGRMVARQLHEMWRVLGAPPRFDVLECGAGRGLLAEAVWHYALTEALDWVPALYYTLADRAPAGSLLRAEREQRLADSLANLGVPAGRVRWVSDPAAAFAPRSLVGCVVANELIDAFPVHIVQVAGDALQEIYVGLDPASGRFMELAAAPSSAAVAGYLDAYGVPWRTYSEGWRAEVCPAAGAWVRTVGGLIRRGLALTIDYGDTARRLYTRDRRRGTLMVYARHTIGDRPLDRPGMQDLTAHVNFSALARAGREVGLRQAGLTTQRDFLIRLGITAAAEEDARRHYPAAETDRQSPRGQLDYLRRASLRTAVRTLLDPAGLGGFRVLVQHRGAPGAARRLTGLRVEGR